MTNAEKVVTRLLSKVKIKKGGPRMVWVSKKSLRQLMVIAYIEGVREGIRTLRRMITGKKRGKKGKRCRT